MSLGRDRDLPIDIAQERGLCWKQLSPAERKEWEDKAVIAQEEHRARYPDWRFRPGTNALSKLKTKEAAASSTRRRSVRRSKASSDGDEDDASMSNPDGKGKVKDGRGKSKSMRLVDEATRCATIAGFVVEGIKGEELEAAVKEWEGSRTSQSTVRSSRSRSMRGTQAQGHARSQSSTEYVLSLQPSTTRHDQSTSPASIDELPAPTPSTPDQPPVVGNNLTQVPLTHMFKRSLSAPASDNRLQNPTSPSEASDESSAAGDQSPVAVDPRSAWPRAAPTGQPSGPYADPDSLPVSYEFSSSTTPTTRTYDQAPPLAWQEDRRPSINQISNADPWWENAGSPAERPSFEYTEPPREAMVDRLSTERMGFQNQQQHQYSGYIGDYGSYTAPSPVQTSQWTNLSHQPDQRQGFATVIEDPYNKGSQAPSSVPATLSIPSLSTSSSSFYQTHAVNTSPVSSPTFSSSYSTLSHWDNYKPGTSDLRPWPEQSTMNNVQDSSSASGWYQPDGSATWGHIRPELQHHGISMDAQDWDRAEYRAGRSLHLNVGPQREATFAEELQRLQGNGA